MVTYPCPWVEAAVKISLVKNNLSCRFFLLCLILSQLFGAGCTGSTQNGKTQNTPCTDDLTFIRDITYPDGSSLLPGKVIEKRWQVQNSGTCDWGAGYTLHMVTGESMGVPDPQPLEPARAGSQAVIEMNFTAPDEPGLYRSVWQAVNPAGEPFGDCFYLEMVVATPVPTVP